MAGNIFLIGFMGAGKSTVSRALHRRYGMKLIEMDERIEEQEGKPISQIFADSGEEYFRSLETALLASLGRDANAVVSCGGGVPMRACNVEAMRKSGKVVYLSTNPEVVYRRVKDTHTRPLLENNMSVDYIRSLMEARIPSYLAAADVIVETNNKGADEVAREIFKKVK